MGKFLIFAFSALAGIALASGEPILRAQFPSLSPDGKTLAFSWQGDLWLVGAQGGEARRLTVHPATDQMPRWMPDGKTLYFASNRYGSFDVFTIGADGQGLKRLSFESGSEIPFSVTPDGRFILGHTNNFGRLDLFRVSTQGGDSVRLTGHPLEVEHYPAAAANNKVYYVAGGPPVWRNPLQRGSYTGDIWVGDGPGPLRNMVNLTQDDFNDIFPLPSQDGNVYFISNRSGWPNLWRMNSQGGNMRQLTQHSGSALRFPSLSDGAKAIVYENGSEIWRLDLATLTTQRVPITVPADSRVNPVAELSLSTGVRDYAVSPDGKRAVIEVRGELFLIPERGGTTRRLTKNVAQDSSPVWLDNKTILFVSGRNIQRELYTVSIDGEEKLFLSDSDDLTNPLLSPDRKTILVQRGATELGTVPASGGAFKLLRKGLFGDAMIGDPVASWSPDSKWLAIEVLNERGSTIVLQPAEGGDSITIARTAKGASTPQFLPNGRGVYFTAVEPERSELYLVDLIPQDVAFSEDDLDKIDEPRTPETPSKGVSVQQEGIFSRMRQLTSSRAGSNGPMASADSRSIYVNIDGVLNIVPVSGGAPRPVEGVTTPVSNIQIGSQGKVYFTTGGRLTSLSQAGVVPVSFNAQMSVNLKDEEMALFKEIWWLIDRFYYDRDFHGQNWKGIREKYEKVVPYAYDRTDFYNLMLEMMEELNSSHLGTTSPPDLPTSTPDSTAWLGVEWDHDALAQRGVFIVQSVYSGTPAAHPNSRLIPGDRVVAVNGTEISSSEPMAKLLNRQDGRKVRLKVQRGASNLEILIRPTSSLSRSDVLYEDFVARQRELVEKLSGGRLTYLHIEGMNDPSYQRFLREIRTLTPGKEGVVIDVRFNGGGSTSHLKLSILIKQPWLERTWRSSPGLTVSENIWRGDSLELPTALLINQNSFSNAEMFAEGFRYYKLGPIAGVPTAGGVISTGQYGLWDGGSIRMPRGGAFASNGENLERNGRKPDFRVNFDPNAWREGRDVQTEKIVAELMKKLPPQRPARPN